MTIDVVIQTEGGDHIPFADQWPIERLNEVFTHLSDWGVVDAHGTLLDVDQASGQFRVARGRAVFEVTVPAG